MRDILNDKIIAARSLVRSCVGRHGLWASPDRYRGQCWTRDLALTQPALFEPSLVRNGDHQIAEQHIREIAARMRPAFPDMPHHGARAPILFLDGLRGHLGFIGDKIRRSIRGRRPSFMLKRYLRGKLWDLTPGTRDSELMFSHALLEHCRLIGSDALKTELHDKLRSAMEYVEGSLLESGRVAPVLHVGCDWRDTREKELRHKSCLSNNAILHAVYRGLGWDDKADRLREVLRLRVDNHRRLLDYEGADRFDPFGGALAVIYDVALPEDYSKVLEGFESVDSPCGVTIRCKHNAFGTSGAEVEVERAEIERTNGVVVWPFIGWLAVRACRKMESHGDPIIGAMAQQFADHQEAKLLQLEGFREFYSPDTGHGWGAYGQMWSAAMLLRAQYERDL